MGLKRLSNHFDIFMAGDFIPAMIGLRGVFGLCAFGRKCVIAFSGKFIFVPVKPIEFNPLQCHHLTGRNGEFPNFQGSEIEMALLLWMPVMAV
ncbi:unnamed protein product [Adineta ricciae]|uniref:Uncharacterized protein n=1 Tax=Adineta ricciae TaxID=249248 RepID=A0A816HWU6_ADIRI|nr:unnamed protein product [Adineta ricciae]